MMMKETFAFEIAFHEQGNTVVGDYSLAERLYAASPKMWPNGFIICAETKQDVERLIENVELFHNCLESVKGWRKVCEFASCRMASFPIGADFLKGATIKSEAAKEVLAALNRPACGLCHGTGKQKSYEETWDCPACNGQG